MDIYSLESTFSANTYRLFFPVRMSQIDKYSEEKGWPKLSFLHSKVFHNSELSIHSVCRSAVAIDISLYRNSDGEIKPVIDRERLQSEIFNFAKTVAKDLSLDCFCIEHEKSAKFYGQLRVD